MASKIIFASLLAIGIGAGAQAASDARLAGGGDDNEITYSGAQENVVGGGTAMWVSGGEYATFSHAAVWPGQGNRIAAYGNGAGGGGEVTYPGSVPPALPLAAIGAPLR